MGRLNKCFVIIQIVILFSSTLKIFGQEEKNYFESPRFEIISKSIDKVNEGDIKGAIKNLEKGIEKFPNDPNLYYARGRIKSFFLKDSLGAAFDNEYAKKISGVDHNRSGFFFPYLKLSNVDTLNYPIKVDLELIFNDIYDFETKNNQFFAKFDYALYSKYDTIYKTFYNKEYDITDLRKIIKLDYISSDQTKISDLKLPNGIKIGAVLKNDNEVHISNPNLEINDGDRVILFSLSKMIKKVENLLSVRFRFY